MEGSATEALAVASGYARKAELTKEPMQIQTCPNCGAKNRVDEHTASIRQPVCGRCGENLIAGDSATPTAIDKPQVVTDASFASDVVSASVSQTVLVDCWAAWCGPCRIIAPVLDELAAESRGQYKIAKLNVDENPRTAAQFNIRSIPTLLIFRNGKVVDQIVGVAPKQAIAAKLAAQI
jgi:thioredoxin 2